MAITTIAGAVTGALPPVDLVKAITTEAAGVLGSTFFVDSAPPAAAAPTGINGAALTSYTNQIPFSNPTSGNTYLLRFEATSAGTNYIATHYLMDRLWHNGSISSTTTTAQAITTPTWPARDRNGSTDGEGVFIALEVSTATGNGGAITNMTMSYTNSAGTAGKTATVASFPATATIGTFVPFTLAAGDTGVRSVESLTLDTSLVSGVVHLVAYRVLALAPTNNYLMSGLLDAISGGFPRLYDNTVPFYVLGPGFGTASTVTARVTFTQG